MSKKKKTKFDEKKVVTPSVPSFLTAPVQGQAGLITSLQGGDASDFVTGASPLQNLAFDSAADRFGGGSTQDPAAVSRDRFADSTPKGVITDKPAVSRDRFTPPQNTNVTNGFNDAFDLASLVGGAGANTATAPNGVEASTFGGAQLGRATGFGGASIGDTTQVGETTVGSGGRSGAASGLTNFDQYQNPFTDQVIDASLADFDQGAGQTRAAQAANAARNGAFGGSRFAIREAATDGELTRGRASLSAGLRSDGFNTAARLSGEDANRQQSANNINAQIGSARALAQGQIDANRELSNAQSENQFALQQAGFSQQAGLFNAGAANDFSRTQFGADQQTGLFNAGVQNDANRFNESLFSQNNQFNAGQLDANNALRLQSAGLMGNLANQEAGSARADLGLLSQLGGTQRDITQENQLAPYNRANILGGMVSNLPINPFTGQTINSSGNSVTSESDPLGAVGAGLGIAGTLFSDRRLKTDIKPLGKRGLHNWYSFKYILDKTTEHIGVMADEVRKFQPELVIRDDSGFDKVNYGGLV